MKPVLYAWALVFSTVVLGLTADKLIFRWERTGRVTCALRGSMATCIYTIIIGSISLLLTAMVTTKRLIVTFSDDDKVLRKYPKVVEALWWVVLSVLWFITAIVITSKLGGEQGRGFTSEQAVVTAFSWLLWGGYALMAVVAWLAPESDSDVVYDEIRKSVRVRRAAERAQRIEREERERKEREEGVVSPGTLTKGPTERFKFWNWSPLSLQRSPGKLQRKGGEKGPQSAPPVEGTGGRGYSWRQSAGGVFRRRMSKIDPSIPLTRAKSDAAASADNVKDAVEEVEQERVTTESGP